MLTLMVSPHSSRSMKKAARLGAVLLAVLLVLGLAAWLWLRTPPKTARLLPECDAILYANVKPLRSATHFDRTPVSRAPEYQAFVDATGIVPERDLYTVALAMHRLDDARGPNGPVAYSEVFEGRFEPVRLERYLASIAAAKESYAGKAIFVIPVGDVAGPGGRRLRVTLLGHGRIAASNAPTTEQIHAMLDRERSEPSLLLARFGAVPWFAPAWGIGQLGLPFAKAGFITAAGLRLPLGENTNFVASVRYWGALTLRVEAMAGTALQAARTAEELSSLLTLGRAIAENQPGMGTGPARTLADSLTLKANGDRVVLTGTMPVDLLRQLTGASVQAPR